MSSSPAPAAGIGIFDSGVGGLSVLRALRQRLPGVPLHYLADSAHAPYGERTVDEVTQRSLRLAEHLLAHGARMVVVACNTATTLAIGRLRARWPEVPFVGVEPGVKPAVAMTRTGRVGVLATRRTIGSDRLRSLIEQHAGRCEVVLQACPGLVEAIEAGVTDEQALQGLLAPLCQPLRDAQVDTVVLGCTHYPFVASTIQSVLGPQVRLVDTADAVAQRAQQVWASLQPPIAFLPQADVRLETTGAAATLHAFARRWLGLVATPVQVAV